MSDNQISINNLSKIYEKVNEMSKINHKKNQQNSNDNNFEISIDGTQLVLKINDKIIKKEIIVNENKELIAIFSLKKDLLSLKYNKNSTYWIEKNGPKSKMKNQF